MQRSAIYGGFLALALVPAPGFCLDLAGSEERARLLPDRLYSRESILLAQSESPTAPGLESSQSPKNPKLAMLYSLLLPGLGELYLGNKGRATGFFVAEGAIWTSYFVFRSQGSHRQDLYKEFASINAGVSERDDDDFYRVIGNYVASDGPFSANEQVRREARLLYPDDRAKQEEYVAENAYQGEDAWTWVSEDALGRYGEMRSGSEDAYNRADLTIGLLVANRLLSVLDAGVLASKLDKQGDGASLRWNLEAPGGAPGGQVTLSRSF